MERNEKLIAARKARHWSQERAAAEIGVTRAAYARWETGGVIPHPWAIEQAMKAFHMTAVQLGFEEAPTTPVRIGTVQSATPYPLESGSTVDLFSVGILALTMAQRHHGWAFDELQTRTEQEIRRLSSMEQQQQQDSLTRRDIIRLLMSAPAAALGIEALGDQGLFHDDEVLALLAVNIPLAWRLYFAGGMQEVSRLLPGYIARVTAIAQRPSRLQSLAAGLTSQAHQLNYLLSIQRQDFSIAQTHVQQALTFAEMTNDPNLLVSSLVRQGNLFYTLKRPLHTMQKYQEAIERSTNASPLIMGQAYIGLAEAKARLGQRDEAERYRGLALDTFPEHPEEDLHFAYTHFNHFTRANFEGLMLLHLGQPQKAWDVFADIEKHLPESLVPQRVELLCRQALTSVTMGDLEQSSRYIELAVKSALQLGSDLRYNEVVEAFMQMQARWPHEQRPKELIDLFIK